MNNEQLKLQKDLELKVIRHAMTSKECLNEVSGFEFSSMELKQTMEKIKVCMDVNGECNLPLLKLSGFNAIALEGELYSHEHSNINRVMSAGRASMSRIKLQELMFITANKMEDYSKPVDVLLTEALNEIEYLAKTNTTKPLFELIPLSKIVPTETEWINRDWIPIPKKAVTLITAKGGTGKSYVTLQMMIRFLGAEGNENKRAFGWFSEDPIGVTRLRAENICTMCGVGKEVLDRLVLLGSEQEVYHLYNTDGVTSAFIQMKRLLSDYELIVLDPLIGFYGEDENNNSHARAFMNGLNAWVNKENKAVVVIHHSSKNDEGQGARGAGAFADAARLSYSISRTKPDGKSVKEASSDNLFFNIFKDNYGAKYYLKYDEYRVFPATVSGAELTITDNSESTKKEFSI